MKGHFIEESHKIAKSSQTLVEKLFKKHEGDMLSRAKLDCLLGERIPRSTLNVILDYLQESNKIIEGPEGFIWIFAEDSNLNHLYKNALRVA